MEPGQPSITAMASALFRSEHPHEDPGPPVLDDTLAGRLVPAAERRRLEEAVAGWAPRVRRALRLDHVVRTRLAEDEALAGLAAGRSDYVLLGAGLDTFAWRHPRAGDFRVWEVDHPDTQTWKLGALDRADLTPGPHVRFLPADLTTAPLGGLGLPAAATWSWLGVTMYLPRAATLTTLRAIAARGRGTTLVADFVRPAGELGELGRAVGASAAAAVADGREPFVADYAAEEVGALLRTAGFRSVTLLDADALRARYLSAHPDLRLSGLTTVAVATV